MKQPASAEMRREALDPARGSELPMALPPPMPSRPNQRN
jgi:hypothetical protein